MTEDVYTIVTIKDEIQVKFESNNFLDVKSLHPLMGRSAVCVAISTAKKRMSS